MATPESIYEENINKFKAALRKAKTQLFASSMLRLGVFILIIWAVYLFWENTRWVIASLLIGLIIFFSLISRHTNLRQKRDKLKALLAINQTEIDVLHRNFSKLPAGESYKNPPHAFSQDIDLFGRDSFFQYLNRTALPEGEQALAAFFTENSTTAIGCKQGAINELGQKAAFRQEFSALARLTTDQKETATVKSSLKALRNHTYFTPKWAKPLANIFSVISLLVITAFFINLITWMQLAIWLIMGLGITGIYIKRVNALSGTVENMQKIFRQYHKLLELLENTSFTSKILVENQNRIASETKKASQILKSFSKTIDALDQRGNLLFGFLGNGFLLWDLRQSFKLERWMQHYSEKVEAWFAVIAQTDAYNSLGNFAFNHPNYTYPEITNSGTVIKAENAVHPMIPEEEAVTNDFKIDHDQFFIITGANMAGKSTFLRTVALQIVMSNMGLPVCATSCEYSPIKLITSMRTVDSLADEASYFYAELSRLKFIIDQLKTENYFVVLDEILKGTNSEDKAIGSQKFLRKLVASNSTGIIATHDLSLCEVADNLPQVQNQYFDAQIINDELFFDYKLKEGICQNMNASFLLKKMEIVDD